MDLTLSQMPPEFTSPFLPDTDTNATSPFLSLPTEIRLLIYNEILVQSDDLLRTFCKCKFCARLNRRTISRDCLTTSLLRTSKAIYNEALPILYTKNLFSFLCYGPFRHSAELGVSTHRLGQPGFMAPGCEKIGLLASCYSPWAGETKMITCPSDTAKQHVKMISLKLLWVYRTILDGFPTQWWQPVESDALRLLPGLEQITVDITPREMPVSLSTFRMVCQRKDLMTERRQDYNSILADLATPLHPSAKAREGLISMEAICDAVVESHTQGEMKNCIFGVKTVSWTDDYPLAADPYSMQKIDTSIHLGYF